MSPSNADRATWADTALGVFRRETGCDHDDCLVDLLCDLMHWAEREEIDFDGALDMSRFHYRAELAEEGGIK